MRDREAAVCRTLRSDTLRVEHLFAPMRRHGTYGSGGGKPKRPWKTAPEHGSSEPPELAFGVSPLSEIHLADSGEGHTELEKAIQIDCGTLRQGRH